MLRKPDFITARAYLADRMTPVETERVSLSEAAGRILAEDLITFRPLTVRPLTAMPSARRIRRRPAPSIR